MKGLCGISFDSDKTFLSFVAANKSHIFPLEEVCLPFSFKKTDIAGFLKEHASVIDEAIRDKEKTFSLKIDDVFVSLPFGMEQRKLVDETVLLRGPKKVTRKDILYARKYVEDAVLGWDDCRLHHVVLSYGVQDNRYKDPPIGIKTNKINLASYLVWVKDSTYKESLDVLGNMGRRFGGFVFSPLSSFASSFDGKLIEKNRVVVDIGYDSIIYAATIDGHFACGQYQNLGVKALIERLSQHFSFSFELAQEVFDRYVGFSDAPYYKEISIKNGSTYVHLGAQAVNSVVKDCLKTQFNELINKIREDLKVTSFTISVIGRLSKKKGFYGFLRGCLPQEIDMAPYEENNSSSFGCVKYGLLRFWEKETIKKKSLLQQLRKVYKEYF